MAENTTVSVTEVTPPAEAQAQTAQAAAEGAAVAATTVAALAEAQAAQVNANAAAQVAEAAEAVEEVEDDLAWLREHARTSAENQTALASGLGNLSQEMGALKTTLATLLERSSPIPPAPETHLTETPPETPPAPAAPAPAPAKKRRVRLI